MFHRSVPDGIVCIFAYHILFGLASLCCGAILLTLSLPSSLAMGSFFMTGSVAIGFTGGFALFLGISTLYSGWGLWHLAPAGRVCTMIISVIMMFCAIPMVFWFLIDNDVMFSMMMGIGGATIMTASEGTLWYLTRPRIKQLFYDAHRDFFASR